MITFIIQYNHPLNLNWCNYTDDEGNNIEFVTKSGAIAVAKDLAASGEVHPAKSENWQILDSHGNVFPIVP